HRAGVGAGVADDRMRELRVRGDVALDDDPAPEAGLADRAGEDDRGLAGALDQDGGGLVVPADLEVLVDGEQVLDASVDGEGRAAYDVEVGVLAVGDAGGAVVGVDVDVADVDGDHVVTVADVAAAEREPGQRALAGEPHRHAGGAVDAEVLAAHAEVGGLDPDVAGVGDLDVAHGDAGLEGERRLAAAGGADDDVLEHAVGGDVPLHGDAAPAAGLLGGAAELDRLVGGAAGQDGRDLAVPADLEVLVDVDDDRGAGEDRQGRAV